MVIKIKLRVGSDQVMYSNSTSSITEPIETPKAFTLFSNFPAELQRKIWKDAMPPPGIVTLQLLTERGKDGGCNLSSSNKPSSLLSVCKTSREIALKIYNVQIRSNDLGRIIRLDGRHDTLLLWYLPRYAGHGQLQLFTKTQEHQLRDVSNLAVSTSKKHRAIKHFSGLTNLVLLGRNIHLSLKDLAELGGDKLDFEDEIEYYKKNQNHNYPPLYPHASHHAKLTRVSLAEKYTGSDFKIPQVFGKVLVQRNS